MTSVHLKPQQQALRGAARRFSRGQQPAGERGLMERAVEIPVVTSDSNFQTANWEIVGQRWLKTHNTQVILLLCERNLSYTLPCTPNSIKKQYAICMEQ